MSLGQMRDRVVIVTGAGGLVGRGIALAFLRAGAQVVIADRDEERARETMEIAASAGFPSGSVVGGDVTIERDVAAIVAAAVERHGRLDVMVNNAAGFGAMVPLLDMEADAFDETLASLLRSVFLGIKHAGRQLRAQGQGGVILTTASAAAHANGIAPDLYSVCKSGVVRLVQIAARELAADRIRVNSVSPGTVWGPGFARLGWDEASLAAEHLLPDPLLPDHVGEAMVWLASDRCPLATGSDHLIDGGLVTKGSDLFDRMRERGRLAAAAK